MLKVWQMFISISQDNARGKLGAQPETTHAYAHSNVCMHIGQLITCKRLHISQNNTKALHTYSMYTCYLQMHTDMC